MSKIVEYYDGKRLEILDFLPNEYSKILEIGCGSGDFRKCIEKECEYWGVEPVEEIAKIAVVSLDKVLIGAYDEIEEQLPDNYFDLIICNDVIEHMVDHNKFYSSIQHKMKENGYIVGSIPNVRFIQNLYELLWKKDWMYKDDGILDKTHLRFFTEKSINRDFIVHNFIVERLSGINARKFKWNSIKGIIWNIFKFILGEDTEYLQFAFRIRVQKLG